MIKQEIWKFIRAGMRMKDFEFALNFLEQDDAENLGNAPAFRGTRIEELAGDKKEEFRAFIMELAELAGELDLNVAQTLFFVAHRDLPRTSQAFSLILVAMRREAMEKLFLYVPADRAQFYENDDVLSKKAYDAFPMAYKELREASNCYAAERYTACVFHTMRAAEIGLRALGNNVGVSFPDKPIELAEWQNIIEQAEAKIKILVNQGQGQQKDDDRKFYAQAAAQFRYFKDGWRIRVAHARETYIGSQALSVLTHACEFFEVLATRLSES